MALFLVDHQMYREAAIEVFYTHAWFNFFQDDFRHTLSFLRDTIPRQSLERIGRIDFTMKEAQCELWTPTGALSWGYPPWAPRVIEDSKFGENSRGLDCRGDWRAVLAFLASQANLPKLSIAVDMMHCLVTFFLEMVPFLHGDDPCQSFQKLGFIFDCAMDVTTTLCSLKTLGALKVNMCFFDELGRWLEREMMERGDVPQTILVQKVLTWHNVDQRLEGSNYPTEQ